MKVFLRRLRGCLVLSKKRKIRKIRKREGYSLHGYNRIGFLFIDYPAKHRL